MQNDAGDPGRNGVKQKVINPWTWQDPFAFVQGKEISGHSRVLFIAGQASVDADGKLLHPDDMRAQMGQALDNLETVLRAAGMDLSNVVRLSYFTTDVDRFFKEHDVIIDRLNKAGCKSVGSLLGVSRLAFPGLLVEMEATAVS
jgi:enamine deaminase RidA (YjgF/YER057c/UK114 family)